MGLSRFYRALGHALLAAADSLDGRFDLSLEEQEELDVADDDFEEFASQAIAVGNSHLPANAIVIPFVGGPQDGMSGTFIPPVLTTVYLPDGEIKAGMQPQPVAELAKPSEDRKERYDLERDEHGTPVRYTYVPKVEGRGPLK